MVSKLRIIWKQTVYSSATRGDLMGCCRTYLVGFADGLDADLHAVELVEAIEDAKHVHPIFGGEVAELRNHVVGIARVAHL